MADNTPATTNDSTPAKQVAPQQLVALQKVQADVVKYASNLLGEERAAEFATRVALISRDNKQLANAIVNNPDSFLSAYMASVTLDLMPNTPEQLAYIIPYGQVVQFQVGYKGLLKLARRSGEILTISAELVFKGDDFDVQYGLNRDIVHRPDFSVNRSDYGNVTHAYAFAKLKNGEVQFAVMTRDELDKIQKTVKSSSTDTPWKQWPERQAIKTVLKRLTQLLPSSSDDLLQKAVAYDSAAEGGRLRINQDGEIITAPAEDAVSGEIRGKIAAAATREELTQILGDLPVKNRKAAAELVNDRLKEIQEAKKAAAKEAETTKE